MGITVKVTTITGVLMWLSFIVLVGIGWVLNLIDIFNSDFANITGLLVLRVIGVFLAPLGSFLGWFF